MPVPGAPGGTEEKYGSWLKFWAAYLYREWNRLPLARLLRWGPSAKEEGCTAVIAMCSRLPRILSLNLKCLESARWPELVEVIVVVDAPRGALPAGFERETRERAPALNIRFEYYSRRQARALERLQLPYVYAWLSWCIGFSRCRTRSALIHDYDALVFGDALGRRYREFALSQASVQGVSWYFVNGISPRDRLACTFEAFVDMDWVRSFRPIQLLNKVGRIGRRRVDFDILLEVQARRTPQEKRTILCMEPHELVHPAQMIHQYTMFRKFPGRALPSWSLPMIPFLDYVAGWEHALSQAGKRIRERTSPIFRLLDDPILINFSLLTKNDVDRMLKQMVEICLNLGIRPFRGLIEYGEALYALAKTDRSRRWLGEFSPRERQWVEAIRDGIYSQADRV